MPWSSPVRRLWSAGIVILVAALFAGPALAAEYVVYLRTDTDEGRFRFDPDLIQIEVGDTVRFVPDSMIHVAKAIAGMIPEGAMRWRARLGDEVLVRFEIPGVYGIKCGANYEVGMVALVLVGDRLQNWEAALNVRHPPMAAHRFAELFLRAACQRHLPLCPK